MEWLGVMTMRTFWKQTERISLTAGRRFGLLMFVPMLLLCAWLMTDTAYAVETTEPTYLFEVSTGARSETGDEDKIDFFIITYAPQKGAGTRNQTQASEETANVFLFPKDTWKDTYALAKAAGGAQEDIDQAINDTYGYKGVDLSVTKPFFQSYSTDQYLFTTPEPIGEIKRVQVFAGDRGSWSCRGMRVFRVDELGGLYRWNTATYDCSIDFKGDLIAEGVAGETSIGWQNDKLISIDSAGAKIDFKTSGFDAAYAHHDLRENNTGKTLALRFDFADTYGSGLEALGAMSAKNNTLTNMGLAETMAVTLYYTDVYGMKRAANVPGVLNAATYTAELLGSDLNKPVSGIAQQGEGMALGVYLPEFVALDNKEPITVTLGASKAQSALGLTASVNKPEGNALEIRKDRIALSESDAASFVTMAVYDLTGTNADEQKNASISASIDESSGAIRYTYRGDPLFYQPVSVASGSPLYTTGPNRLSLTAYEHGKLLAPRDNPERYLFTLTTDEVTGAGTKDDILMRISYTDLSGNVKTTDSLNVRTLSRDLNGWWYGSADQDIGYLKGVAAGQTLQFIVPMTQVKTIENVEVWLSETGSHDDWQMADLSISTVSFYDKRAVVWEAFSLDGVTGELYFKRDVTSTEIYRYTDTTENPVLIQQGSDQSTEVGPSRADIDGGGVEVTKAKNVDWSKIRYDMSFQEASQDLGFLKERFLYAVTVNVGGASDASAEDGDCGSKNLFYFRLVFKNGNSGFVLANQQLSSDGFIAGASQTLYISTNQDYGDVTAVQIIPEDSSEDADVFDKLMIKSIQIKRQGNAALVPVWTVNNVGWIDIDYRDQGQLTSVTGMAGRSATDLTRSFAVDGSTFEVNFMLAIQTEGYPENAPQFEGNLSAIVYYDSYSPSKGYEEISDVTKNMYSYMNRTSVMADSVGGKTISDPSLMHRAGHTDRFYFSLSDVRSIKRIELQATSAVNTTWKIANVSLFMVNGEGSLILNSFGEYQLVYAKDEQLTELAHSTSENSPAYQQILQAYDRTLNSYPAVININFTENEIPMNPEAKQWTSIVAREPASENDTLNLFLYLNKDAKSDPFYSPVAVIQYTDASDQAIQISTGDMNRATYNDQEVFYITGLNAKRFGVLNSVNLRNGRGDGVRGSVNAVVQQVRSGVVIKMWELSGNGDTNIGGMVIGNRAMTTVRQQRVYFQLGADTLTKALSAVMDDSSANNLAVALWYRADDPSGMELRSPYIYLTDQGYSRIRPGQVISLSFDQKNIAEITGISIVSAGEISGSVDAAYIVDEEVSIESGETVETKGIYSFAESLTVSNMPYRMNVDERTVEPLSLTFATALSAASDVSAGTSGPVRMTVGYYDPYGDFITRVYEDIRPYIADGTTGFLAGSNVKVEMLLSNAKDLRWIELEPYSEETEAEGQRAVWTLDSLTATLGESRFSKHCDVKAQIVEGTPLRLNMADILIGAEVRVDGAEEPQNVEGGSLDLLVSSGSSIRIVPKITGSYEGFTAVLAEIDTTTGTAGDAALTDTRGYTAESVAAKAAAASDSREAAIWNAVQLQTGSFDVGEKEITFTPPRNYTDKSMQYKIKVASSESASSSIVINIAVKNESNPVTEQLEALSRTIEAEKLENLQRQINEMNSMSGFGMDMAAGSGESAGAGE